MPQGLLGGFRNVQDPTDFNAVALQLAGDPGQSGQRGLLGQQYSQGPDAGIDPGALPGNGIMNVNPGQLGRFDQIRSSLGLGEFPRQTPENSPTDTIEWIRRWEQLMPDQFTPMGGNSPFYSRGLI